MAAPGQHGAGRQIHHVVLLGGNRGERDGRSPERQESNHAHAPIAPRLSPERSRREEHGINRESDVQRWKAVQRGVVRNKYAEHHVGGDHIGAWTFDRQE